MIVRTPKPNNVSIASPYDEDELYNILSEELFSENGTFSLSEKKSRSFIRDTINGRNYGIIGIIRENGKIAGTIGMNLESFWYSDDFLVSEYWNFVRKDYRNHKSQDGKDGLRSFYAKDLIDFGKWFSETMDMILNIGIISTTRTQAKCRLYGRMLTPVGQFFMHNLEVAKGPGVHIKMEIF